MKWWLARTRKSVKTPAKGTEAQYSLSFIEGTESYVEIPKQKHRLMSGVDLIRKDEDKVYRILGCLRLLLSPLDTGPNAIQLLPVSICMRRSSYMDIPWSVWL